MRPGSSGLPESAEMISAPAAEQEQKWSAVMSLPFTKNRPQQEDEQAVSREPRCKEFVKRWRGIEIGFKLRITEMRRYEPAQPGHEAGLIVPPNAALDVAP